MAIISQQTTAVTGNTITAAIWNDEFSNIINDYNGNITNANIAAGAAISASKISGTAATLNGSETFTNKTLTSPVINVGSDAEGDVYYRNSSGVFTRLAPGTSGQLLQTQGSSNPPQWANIDNTDLQTVTACRAWLGSNQEDLVDSTETTVVFDQESYDIGSNFNTSTGIFTVPTTGYYLVNAQVTFTNVVANKRYFLQLQGTSTAYTNTDVQSSMTDSLSAKINDLLYLTSGETLKVEASSFAGVNTVDILAGTAATYFSITLLSV